MAINQSESSMYMEEIELKRTISMLLVNKLCETPGIWLSWQPYLWYRLLNRKNVLLFSLSFEKRYLDFKKIKNTSCPRNLNVLTGLPTYVDD